MPIKTTSDLFNTALAELEQIIAELEFNDDLNESLSEFEPDMKTNLLTSPCSPAAQQPQRLIPPDDL